MPGDGIMTAPAGLGARPHLEGLSVATRTDVAAGDIAGYRQVVRSLLFRPAADGASPVHGFVLSHPAFNALIERLFPGNTSLVHLQQELTVHRGIQAGDTIRTFAEVTSLRSEPQGARVTIACSQTDDGGGRVTDLKATVLLKGYLQGEDFGANAQQASPVRALPGADPVEFEVTPTQSFINAYALASGDHNPIHTSPAAARDAGFPGPIAHGMSSLAVGCEIAADRLGSGRISTVRSLGARFSLPILPGEPLIFSFRPTALADTFVFGCTTPRGPAIKAGWMRISDAAEPRP